MIHQMQLDEIVLLLKKTPEQQIFDWKSDYAAPNDHEKQGEHFHNPPNALTAFIAPCTSISTTGLPAP
jgi:hypothetical protein